MSVRASYKYYYTFFSLSLDFPSQTCDFVVLLLHISYIHPRRPFSVGSISCFHDIVFLPIATQIFYKMK